MKVFINEIYKVFIKRKLIILLIAVLIIECAITFSSLNKSTVMDEDSLIVYNQYIDEYGGELTDEKREKIEHIIETTRRSETLKSEKRSEYLKGNITLEEYKVSLKKIQEDTKGEEGFFRFVDAYYHAVNSNISLADSHIWDVLFGYGSIDFLLVIFVIMMVISLTVYDDETGTNKLKFTLKKGKSTLISAQIITAILISFVLPAFVFAGRLVIARVFFNLDGFNNPISFSEVFSFSPWNITLIEGYFYINLIKILGYVYLAILTMVIGQLCHSSLSTIFVGIISVYIPGYVLTDIWEKYMLPLPSSLLSGNGYFTMTENCSMISSQTADSAIKSFTPKQLIVYFSGIVLLLFLLCVINRLLWLKRKALS